jgi:Tfp pilus assembly protein PilO
VRKSVIITGVSAVLITVYVLFVMPLPEKKTEMHEELGLKYTTLMKYEKYIKARSLTESELASAKKDLDALQAGIINQTDDSLAFAGLQNKVQDMAEKSGLRILSLRPLVPEKHESYFGLPMTIECFAGVKQFSDFLKLLDGEDEFIKVDKLNVTVQDSRTEDKLRIRMQVSGLKKA